jgi:drug/metabolite transporter (DMT)-like permease
MHIPMNRSLAQPLTQGLGFSPAISGTACCMVAAVGYTAANVILPSWRWLAALVLVGLLVEVVGNLGTQWAFGVVGLAVTIPAVYGLMLTGSAVMGRWLLGERVSLRSAGAIGLLLAALVLLGLGAETASRYIAGSVKAAPTASVVVGAIAAAGVAGIIYALFTITIRRALAGSTRQSLVVFVITGVGVVSLGSLSFLRLGAHHLLSTPPEHLAWMFLAGVCNLIAFLAIILIGRPADSPQKNPDDAADEDWRVDTHV